MSKEHFIDLALNTPSRFDMAKFMAMVGDNRDPLTSRFLDTLQSLKPFGFFVIQGEENRPDTISVKIYGTDQYWWVIMLYNAVLAIDDLKAGTSLKFPSIRDLEDAYFNLKALESAAAAAT